MIGRYPNFRIKFFPFLISFCCLLSPMGLSAREQKIDSLLNQVRVLENKGGNITEDTNLIEVYYSVANEYFKLYNTAEENIYTNKALDLVTQMLAKPGISYELKKCLLSKQAKGYGNIGIFYEKKNDFVKALDFYFRALKINEDTHDKSGMRRDYSNISICYGALEEHEKSIDYGLRALALAKTLNSPDGEALLYGNIATEYVALDSNDLALKFATKGLKMFQDLKDTTGIIADLGNIAIAYTNLGNHKLDNGADPHNIPEYRTAVVYYKKAIDLAEIIGNKRGKEIHLTDLATVYISMKEYANAKMALLQSLELSKELQDLYGVMEADRYLSELYDSLRDYKHVFEYYKDHIAARDSIFNIENTKKNVATEMNFGFEKKKAIQAAEHEKEVAALEAENRIQKNTRNFIILLAVMLLVLVTLGFVYFNNRKALQLRELYSQQLLLSQEKERQRISKELHDSIGQNILFIKNQMIKNNDLSLMSSVDETLEEVRNISKDLYPNQLEKYGLVAAVDALAEKVKESSGIFVSYDLDVIDKELSPDEQINYYRIIQECVTNTLKHAEASALRISASKNNGTLELVVQDNGKGFDKGILSKKAQQSFGLLNLEERVKHLKGKLVLETSPGKGTKYIFSIPS